MYLARRYK